MPGKVDESAIVDNAALIAFMGDGGSHAIIQEVAWSTADGLPRGDIKSQQRGQALVHDKAGPG